ncbi:MAG: hypothetical protein ACREUQ_13150, partial [Burkholderiales bacterium]
MSSQSTGSDHFDAVACPFCGLLCDDLRVAVTGSVPRVVARGCGRSQVQFAAQPAQKIAPLIEGKQTSLDSAVLRAAQILREARLPVLISAGTDVAGMRALIALAERVGGVVDHANSDALMRNLLVLQDTGWISTTFTEVRNRADLIIIAGSGATSRFPRFLERCLQNSEPLFVSGEREIWFLGKLPADLPAVLQRRSTSIDIEPKQLGEVFAALRALMADRPLRAARVAGIALERLSQLLSRMREARYGVLTWAAAELDFPHAELAIQSMCELVQALNAKTRFSVLPLAGSDGDVTATQVCTWQTGYPLRVSFAGGAPHFDPLANSASALLANGNADAVVFVSALDSQRSAPVSRARTIVLGRPGTSAGDAAVFIPVATPGIHHA